MTGKASENSILHEPLFFRLLVRWGPPVLWALSRAYFSTCRFVYPAQGAHQASQSPRGPFIYVAWHRDILMLSQPYRKHNVVLAISRSRDGELAAQTMQRLGYRVVRGSSSRGGIAALRALIMMVGSGQSVGILADGPRGPAGETKEGVIYLAYKTRAPLIPLAAKAKKSIAFHSWDRMVLPLPFTRISIIEGEPLFLPSELNREDFAVYSRQLTQHLNDLHRNVGEQE